MKNFTTKKLCINALLAAMVCIATMIIQIPVAGTEGYIHLGDSIILIAAILFGGQYGLIAGGIGSGLADLLSGYTHWVIPTLIIKGLMGFIIGKISNFKGDNFFSARNITASIAGIVWMVFGYFIGGALLKGSFIVSLASIPSNCVQGIGGLIIYYVAGFALYKAKVFKLIDAHEN